MGRRFIPDGRTLVVVLLLVGSASAVGGVAGYRLYVQEVVLPDSDPVALNVTVAFPDNTTINESVTLVGTARNAFDALRAAAEEANVTVHHRLYPGGDVYVYRIGTHVAEGQCGWVYSVDGIGLQYQPDVASNHVFLDNDQSVHWAWGCA